VPCHALGGLGPPGKRAPPLGVFFGRACASLCRAGRFGRLVRAFLTVSRPAQAEQGDLQYQLGLADGEWMVTEFQRGLPWERNSTVGWLPVVGWLSFSQKRPKATP